MVLPAGLTPLGDTFGTGWSLPEHTRSYFQSPAWMSCHAGCQQAEAEKEPENVLPLPCRGQIPSPSPTTTPPLTQGGLAGLSLVQLWQESCSNSLPDPATPITKGLAQYPREGGARTTTPIPKGSVRGTETSQHIYSAPSI